MLSQKPTKEIYYEIYLRSNSLKQIITSSKEKQLKEERWKYTNQKKMISMILSVVLAIAERKSLQNAANL